MPQQLLNSANVSSTFKQVSRKGMAQRMTCHTLWNAGRPRSPAHCPLENSLVEMVAASDPGRSLTIRPRRRKHILPDPFALRIGKFPAQTGRQERTEHACGEITLKSLPRSLQVNTHRRNRCRRQRHPPVLVSLATSDENLAPIEIHVLDAQRQTLRHTKTAAIHQCRTQTGHTAHRGEHTLDLALRQHIRQPTRPASGLDSLDKPYAPRQYMAIQKENGLQSLVLRRSTHPSNSGKVCQERRDLRLAHGFRMPPVMEQNELPHPVAIRLLGFWAVVPRPQAVPQALHETESPLGVGAPG